MDPAARAAGGACSLRSCPPFPPDRLRGTVSWEYQAVSTPGTSPAGFRVADRAGVKRTSHIEQSVRTGRFTEPRLATGNCSPARNSGDSANRRNHAENRRFAAKEPTCGAPGRQHPARPLRYRTPAATSQPASPATHRRPLTADGWRLTRNRPGVLATLSLSHTRTIRDSFDASLFRGRICGFGSARQNRFVRCRSAPPAATSNCFQCSRHDLPTNTRHRVSPLHCPIDTPQRCIDFRQSLIRNPEPSRHVLSLTDRGRLSALRGLSLDCSQQSTSLSHSLLGNSHEHSCSTSSRRRRLHHLRRTRSGHDHRRTGHGRRTDGRA